MKKFEELPYPYDSLEPYIDERTMRIHHDKHHKAYFDKFNKAIIGVIKFKGKNMEEILSDITQIPEEIRTSVVNNGGGHLNHSFFWKILKKDIPIKGKILDAINDEFGSLEEFKIKFNEKALSLFGSGWVWLVVNNKRLEIISTKNQDNPLSIGKKPLLCIDLWEHAYYLKYQNKRAEYVENFFKVINWNEVNSLFSK